MDKEFYFECDCGGKATHRVFDLIDEENKFDVSSLEQAVFECEECGKRYYCGDWENFCWAEEDL